jgi:hypothetical protein
MTSDAMNGPMRSTQPVAIRWRRYLSELAAMQPPPPPAIVRLASSGRLTAADSLTMLCEQHRSCVFRPPFCDQESLCTGPQLRALRGRIRRRRRVAQLLRRASVDQFRHSRPVCINGLDQVCAKPAAELRRMSYC